MYDNKIIKRGLLFFCFLSSFNIADAQINSDTLDRKFKQGVENAIVRHIGEINSDKLSLAYFNQDSVLFNKTYNSGGLYYLIKFNKKLADGNLDTSLIEKKLLLETNANFNDFLNYMISGKSDSPHISSLQDNWIYVYMPKEEWEKFYLDYLLGYESLLIHTEMDYFNKSGTSVIHTRYRFTFLYEKKKDTFKLLSDKIVRQKKLIPSAVRNVP